MPVDPRLGTINLKNVQPHPELQPKNDGTFSKLFKLAMNGKVPTYFGLVPLRLIVPFDVNYLPQCHEDGNVIFKYMLNRIDLEKPPAVWVYPKDGMFTLSDDYVAYEAFRISEKEHLPCFILGNPNAPEVLNPKGPLKKKTLLKAMGVLVK